MIQTTHNQEQHLHLSLVAADLLEMRKNMGKYGVNPSEVVYIVSQRSYYNLLEDAEFQDANLVGDMATKLSGEIGQVFGSRVLLCDEFATPAVSKVHSYCCIPKKLCNAKIERCHNRIRLRSSKPKKSLSGFTKIRIY